VARVDPVLSVVERPLDQPEEFDRLTLDTRYSSFSKTKGRKEKKSSFSATLRIANLKVNRRILPPRIILIAGFTSPTALLMKARFPNAPIPQSP